MGIERATAPTQHLDRAIAQRVRQLGALVADLGKAVTVGDVAGAVLRHGMTATGATGGAIALVGADGQILELIGTQGDARPLFPARRCRLNAHVPLAVAARTGKPVWSASSEVFHAHYPRLEPPDRNVALGSVPLARAGMPLGAVGFVFDGPYTFDPGVRAFIHTLSRHCLDALLRARFHDDESLARRGAENTAARLERLQSVTAELNRTADGAMIARIVAREALGGTQARACLVAVWKDGAPRLLAEAGSNKEAILQARRAFDRALPAVMKSQMPLWPGAALDDHIETDPDLTAKSNFALIPVFAEGRLLCAIGVKLGKKRRLQNEARVYLCALASLCSQAIARARLYEAACEACERAEKANRMKDEFLGIVSHELRTPLTAISCWVALLRRGLPEDHELSRAVDRIDRNTKMQVRLVEDLLDASRIVHDKLQLQLETVDLAAVLANAREALAHVALAKKLELVLVLPENPLPPLIGDSIRLEQVVRNLLSNAIKFTPAGGVVELRLSALAGAARIEVLDSGQGISPELLPHIFERFRQGDGSSSRQHGGLGLGLSIVRHLVEAHGGRVGAHSDGVGRGTKMTVELPFDPAKGGQEERVNESADGATVRPDVRAAVVVSGRR
jgi:hypothetical protein